MEIVQITMDEEHLAMLDAMVAERGFTSRTRRSHVAKLLLYALLEEDAAAHGSFPNPADNVVIFRRVRG